MTAHKSEKTTDAQTAPEDKVGFIQRTAARYPRATRVFAIVGVGATALVAASTASAVKKSKKSPDVILVDGDSYRDAVADAPTGTEA